MYNHEHFVKSMKIIDDTIDDNCSEAGAYLEKVCWLSKIIF